MLFSDVIFGPIKSRRLGISLGVNLLPEDIKVCNYDCIYCECGWTDKRSKGRKLFHDRSFVFKALENKLIEMKKSGDCPDAITFAGNGEPTLHPEFSGIIDDVIELRNRYFKTSKIAVLTNGTLLNKSSIIEALKKVDMPIVKLDAGKENTFEQINQPLTKRTINWLVNHMHYLKGKLIIQALFLKGKIDGKSVDNSSSEEVKEWVKHVVALNPERVMIYSLDREAPAKGLEAIGSNELDNIANILKGKGILAEVY